MKAKDEIEIEKNKIRKNENEIESHSLAWAKSTSLLLPTSEHLLPSPWGKKSHEPLRKRKGSGQREKFLSKFKF